MELMRMSWGRVGLFGAGMLMLVLATGCSVLPPSKPKNTHHFLLEVPVTAAAANPSGMHSSNTALMVSTPTAHGALDTPRMAYMRRPQDLEYFTHSRWADLPGRLMLPLIVHALENGGGFQGVIPVGAGLNAGLRLDTQLLRMHQDFTVTPSEWLLTLRAQLLDITHGRVLATEVFDIRAQAPEDSPYGGAQAANDAVAELLPRLVGFARRAGENRGDSGAR